MADINIKLLKDTIVKLMAKGKGILAVDESNGTADKRLAEIKVKGSEEVRRQYRELFLVTPEIENYISGVILYDETFWQKVDSGKTFPELLAQKNIVPGIKVDIGAKDFPGFPGEKLTKGLDGLNERAQKYFDNGARFAKWRAVITIDKVANLPTKDAIEANADAMARYARICQEVGLVPIVEPEVMLVGNHSVDDAEKVTAQTITKVFEKMRQYQVFNSGLILKTSMVISGDANPKESSAEEVADRTVRILRENVPEDVGGVVFLSGGQTPIEATTHFDAIVEKGDFSFEIAFSYARALQSSALRVWKGKEENKRKARAEFLKRLKLNQLADAGDYDISMEYAG